MADFGEIAKKAKTDAEAKAAEDARGSAEKLEAGTIVLRDKILPILRKAEDQIGTATGVFCFIEPKFKVGQKPIVVFTCASGPSITNLDADPLAIQVTFESDGEAVYARIGRQDSAALLFAPVHDADLLIESAIKQALDSYHEQRLSRGG